MVSKCANPDCSAQFRYLRNGKLFRIHNEMLTAAEAVAQNSLQQAATRRDRFFWLCNECAGKMTLVFEDGKISTRPLVRARAASAGS